MEPSLSQTFDEAARRFPRRLAVVHDIGAVSYAELAAGVEAMAGRLHGFGAGERVGLLLPNVAAFPLALYAVLRAGRSVVMLNPLNSAREVSEALEDAGVRDVVTAEPLLPLIPAEVRAILVDRLPQTIVIRDRGARRALPLQGGPPAPATARWGDDEAVVLYTSAHRGWARGAALSHRNLVANLGATREAMALTAEDRVLAVLPLIHAFGLTVTLNATLSAGGAMVPTERFNPLRVLDLLEEERITVLAGVPALYLGLLATVPRRGVPQHALRLAISGGAPLDPEIARHWETTFGLPLRQGYGLTEASPVCLFNALDRPNRPGTLGVAFPGVAASIRDPDGAELPDSEVGELCLRGENVFGGYLGDGGRRPEDFHGDWLRTGDLASREADGTIRYRGMLKPMFTRNGFNVYPAELERVLDAHPAVARATVCALPNPLRENDIVLFLRTQPGASLGEEEVKEYCRTRLAAYKQPSRIEISG